MKIFAGLLTQQAATVPVLCRGPWVLESELAAVSEVPTGGFWLGKEPTVNPKAVDRRHQSYE
jgi:hypothetical protein